MGAAPRVRAAILGPIAGLLWDIYDASNRNDNQPDKPCGEAYWEDAAHTFIFSACRTKLVPPNFDIFTFYDRFVAQHPEASAQLTSLFCEHGIDPANRGTEDRPGLSEDPLVAADVTHRFPLRPNQPNPFREGTTIHFSLPREGAASLDVYDVRGRLVRQLLDAAAMPAGPHSATWDGRDGAGRPVDAGVYFYRLATAAAHLQKKMVVLE